MASEFSAFAQSYEKSSGLDNMESDLAGYVPKAEQLEVLDMDDHFRESWYLWVEPTVPLPFYLLRFENISKAKFPLILAPHGHNHPHIYAGIAHYGNRRKNTCWKVSVTSHGKQPLRKVISLLHRQRGRGFW